MSDYREIHRKQQEELTRQLNTNEMGKDFLTKEDIGKSDRIKEPTGYIHYKNRRIPLVDDKKIEEYGNFVAMVGHNLEPEEVAMMMKTAVDNFMDAMVINKHSLLQKVEFNIQEVMRPDEFSSSPDLLPFTFVSWKVNVEVAK